MLPSLFFGLVLPVANPVGFGPADLIEAAVLVALLLLTIVWSARLRAWLLWFAERRLWCFTTLVALPVVLRLILLAHHPAPVPDVYDEFSHLLVADTLRHFRLANPPLAMPRFFETFFVLQRPTYSSIYPLGQGLVLAAGEILFATAWAGVIAATALFCGLCYWMLLGWIEPRWALLGGVLAVIEFGPLNPWMNSYWGGSLAAAAGCLIFGALPRLQARCRVRDAILLGAGFGIHLLTRPFETVPLSLAVALFFLPALRRSAWLRFFRTKRVWRLAWALAAITPAILLTLAQNHQVAGSWTTMPYRLSQLQYGVPAALTFQAPLHPTRELTPQQALDFQMQSSFRSPGPETLGSFLERLLYRVRYYRFFFLPPLYVALLAFLGSIRRFAEIWIVVTLSLFALSTNLFPAFQVHYVAGVTSLFLLVSILGLKYIHSLRLRGVPTGRDAAALLIYLCFAQFAFLFAAHVWEDSTFSAAIRPFETWNGLNDRNAPRRRAIGNQLSSLPGRKLIFVRYSPNHRFQEEWVNNAADMQAATVVWARDLGPEEDVTLRAAFPGHSAWLLDADVQPQPVLTPYKTEATPKPEVSKSPFEEVK